MEPRLDIQAAGVRPSADDWLVAWRLRNDGAAPLRLVESWLPHGKFRGARRAFDLNLAPGETIELELPVRCTEPPGAVVENCFLILRVTDRAGEWRLLTRVRVAVGPDGAPAPAPEVVTAQRVGFAD